MLHHYEFSGDHLYIGAILYDSEPDRILGLLGKPRTLIRHVEDRPGHGVVGDPDAALALEKDGRVRCGDFRDQPLQPGRDGPERLRIAIGP